MTNVSIDFKLDPRRTAIVVIDLQKGIIAMPGAHPIRAFADRVGIHELQLNVRPV
jgi:nicotinamidase-related amidase